MLIVVGNVNTYSIAMCVLNCKRKVRRNPSNREWICGAYAICSNSRRAVGSKRERRKEKRDTYEQRLCIYHISNWREENILDSEIEMARLYIRNWWHWWHVLPPRSKDVKKKVPWAMGYDVPSASD